MLQKKYIECVPNFSEGRRLEVIDAIIKAISVVPDVKVLDRTSDAEHNRSVVTFAGSPEKIGAAAFLAIEKAAELIDMQTQHGKHPRIGATDVMPFVPIKNTAMQECVNIARAVAKRVGEELHIPVYLYADAASRPERKKLSDIRKGEYEALCSEIGTRPERTPDFGPNKINLKAGATVIGARNPLIAYNIFLATPDMKIAKKISTAIRESSGGMKFVQAIPIFFPDRNQTQVSMNLINYKSTSMKDVFKAVAKLCKESATEPVESELIGLVPRDAVDDEFLKMAKFKEFKPEWTIEHHLA